MEFEFQYLADGKFLEAIKRRLPIPTVRKTLFLRIGSESAIGPQDSESIFPVDQCQIGVSYLCRHWSDGRSSDLSGTGCALSVSFAGVAFLVVTGNQ